MKRLISLISTEGKNAEQISKEVVVGTIINLVWNSKRTMPAHFTSNGIRTQSFCVDFDDIDEKDEYQMASVAYYEVGNYVKPEDNLTKEQYMAFIKCGEDVMISVYIAKKLNQTENIKDIAVSLIEMNKKSWPEKLDISKVFDKKSVKEWFGYCEKYGREQGL